MQSYQATNDIFHRARTICMEIQKKKNSNSQSNLEKEEWNRKKQPAWVQTILQSYSHQDSMVLAQRQKYRSIEQNTIQIIVAVSIIEESGLKAGSFSWVSISPSKCLKISVEELGGEEGETEEGEVGKRRRENHVPTHPGGGSEFRHCC